MSKPTIIKFKKPWQGYGPNEVAGFAKEKADQLIEAGVAEAYAKGKGATATQPAAPRGGAAGATTLVTTPPRTKPAITTPSTKTRSPKPWPSESPTPVRRF